MRLRTLLLALVLLLGLAACGGDGDDEAGDGATTTEAEPSDEGDAEAGAQVFAQAGCGGCHVLAAANSSGTTGPNLDDSKPDFDLVVERVTNGQGLMPSFKDQLSEQEINDVAAYVSESAGG
jgi:cytochrome c551